MCYAPVVQGLGEYTEERASGIKSSPAPCTKVREPASTVRLTTQANEARTSLSGWTEGVERHTQLNYEFHIGVHQDGN